MCRSIKQLRQADHPPSDEEIQAAALQFIRKVSGYRKPSRLNQEAFDKAVAEVSQATRTLLEDLARPEYSRRRRPDSEVAAPVEVEPGSSDLPAHSLL